MAQNIGYLFICLLFWFVINFVLYKIFIKESSKKKILIVSVLTVLESFAAYSSINTLYQFIPIIFFILSVMFISDIEKMEVPWWTVGALPLSCIAYFIYIAIATSMMKIEIFILIGTLVFYYIALSIIGFLFNNMLGGADIIMISFMSLLYGLYHTSIMLIIGCSVTIICMIINQKINKTDIHQPIPFLPGLVLGSFAVFPFI